MDTDGRIRPVIGDCWVESARRLAQSALIRSVSPVGYDVAAVRAPFDLLVAGVSALGDLPDEPVVTLADQLGSATLRVCRGHARATVELSESPIHLVLEGAGDDVSVSAFKTLSPHTMMVDRVATALATWRDDIAGFLRSMVEPDGGMWPRGVGRRLRALSLELAHTTIADAPRATVRVGAMTVDTRRSDGAVLATRLAPESTGLLTAARDLPFDLHPLLVTGRVTLGDATGATISISTRPLRVLPELLEAIVDAPDGAPPALIRTAPDDALQVRVGRRVLLDSGASADVITIDRDVLVSLLCDHVSTLLSTTLRVAPGLSTNAHFRELVARVRAAPRQDQSVTAPSRSGAEASPGPGLGRTGVGDARLRAAPPNILRAHLEPSLVVARAHLDGAGVRLREDGAVLLLGARRGELLAASGRRRWSLSFPSAPTFSVDGDRLIAATADSVAMWDVASGRPGWAVDVRRAGDPTGLYTGRVAVVVRWASGLLTCHAATDGALRWTRCVAPGASPRGGALRGHVYADAHQGRAVGRDLRTGDEVWSVALERGRTSLRPATAGFAYVSDAPAGGRFVLGVLDAADGEELARVEKDGDVECVGWSEAGPAVVARRGGARALVWVGAEGHREVALPRPVGPRRGECRPSGRGWIVSADGTLARVDPGGVAWSTGGRGHRQVLGRFSPDAAVFGVAVDDEVRLVDAESGRVLARAAGVWERPVAVASDRAGRVVVTDMDDAHTARVHGFALAGLLVALDGGGG